MSQVLDFPVRPVFTRARANPGASTPVTAAGLLGRWVHLTGSYVPSNTAGGDYVILDIETGVGTGVYVSTEYFGVDPNAGNVGITITSNADFFVPTGYRYQYRLIASGAFVQWSDVEV